MNKIYKCCICHKIFRDDKPIRLVEQHYGIGNYKQYANYRNYDFCKSCFKKFENWINKHKVGE